MIRRKRKKKKPTDVVFESWPEAGGVVSETGGSEVGGNRSGVAVSEAMEVIYEKI